MAGQFKPVRPNGHDVLDLTPRAAMHALGPELQRINGQNEALGQQLAVERHRNLEQALDRALPNWREINQDSWWLAWLHGIHNLTGRPRQQWLDDAVAKGDADRVIRFFRDFLAERAAAKQHERAAPAYRGPRPAPLRGKPTYTRAQIAELYAAHRKGAYAGHEAEWARQEQDIIAAGREGRVIGARSVTGR